MKSSSVEQKVNQTVVKQLTALLGDLHQLLIKTLSFHWNVEDSRFQSLHALFEEEYQAVFKEMDLVAERIRALGFKTPVRVQELSELKRITDTEECSSADKMIAQIVHDYKQLSTILKHAISESDSALDFATSDLLTDLLRDYEKRIWILKSHLKGYSQ